MKPTHSTWEDIYITPSAKKISVRDLSRILYEEYPAQVIKGLQQVVATPRKSSGREILVKELRAKGLTIREIMKIIGAHSTSVVAHYLNKDKEKYL
jgi:hypothetical protein